MAPWANTVMKIIYYNSDGPRSQRGFRGFGEALLVEHDPNRPWDENHGVFPISEHLYWSLFHLGIIEDLAELPHEGLLGGHEEGILFNSGLIQASKLLHSYAQTVASNERYDWRCAQEVWPDKIEYRIIVDGERLRQELIGLADFLREGATRGLDVQLWL
jgi:hypothetical protein